MDLILIHVTATESQQQQIGGIKGKIWDDVYS